MIRQPIITVLGHVDHGKTSILDAIRNSKIADKEAGAITQHIGATEIPIETIQKISGDLIKKFGFQLKIPGLLLIDTPGHEAFTNLRKRGGSIADLAILVVDVMQGLQPQTIEAINILKINKVPFIIAMNKIDMLAFYESKEGSFINNITKQTEEVKQKLDEKLYIIVGKLFEHGFQSERFDRCEFGKQIPIVPCSAKTKEGLPEILTLLAGLSQKYLEQDLEINHDEKGKATVLEAKEEKGLGKTIDIILYQGKIQVNDEIALIGKNGIINTKVRALLQTKPLQEMIETKEKFCNVKEAFAASGIKISAPNLDNVLVGTTLIVVKNEEDKKEIEMELKPSFTTDKTGVIIKADAIGSLEAIVELFKKEKILIKKAEIGNINRKDVMEASTMACENNYLGIVIGFNVIIDKDAEKEANAREIRIFNNKVIYKILEEYTEWVEKNKKLEKEKDFSCMILPAKIRFLKGKVFRNNKPAIFGARIEEGKLKEGWRLINDNGKIIGKIVGMQSQGEKIKEAKKGDEIAISIDEGNIGKNLFENEVLYSCIPTKQYCELNKYLDEFNEEEKKLLKEIQSKNV
jgi:translation initiation factor 5B